MSPGVSMVFLGHEIDFQPKISYVIEVVKAWLAAKEDGIAEKTICQAP
jgi:hypothetical protein